MIVFVVLLRLAVMPQYLQSYLNMAYHKLEGLKQEAGKVTNMDIQKLIARVFYYLCVVTLQYVAPLIMILFLSLMYKTMGGGNWTGLWSAGEDASPLPVQEPEPVRLEVMPKSEVKIDKVFGDEEANEELSRQFSLAWHSLKHVRFLHYKVVQIRYLIQSYLLGFHFQSVSWAFRLFNVVVLPRNLHFCCHWNLISILLCKCLIT